MRIVFVAPGALPVPPPGYGGIELVIENYRQVLVDKGHEVRIVNVRRSASSVLRKFRKLNIVRSVNLFKPDLVHIMKPRYFQLSCQLKSRAIFLTNHNPPRCIDIVIFANSEREITFFVYRNAVGKHICPPVCGQSLRTLFLMA